MPLKFALPFLRRLTFLLSIFPFIFGCNYTKLKGVNGDNSRFSLPPEQKAQLSYGMVDAQVLGPRCVSCHGTSGGVSLERYPDVVANLDKIKNAVFVTHTMPKRGDLNDHEMSILWSWIEIGSPEKAPGCDNCNPTPLEPTYDSIKQNIFERKCVACHSPGKPAARVSLEKDNLLNSPLELVLPGNPDESGLVIAIERNDDKRMPPAKEGYSPLKNEEKSAIRDWIQNGAKD